MATGRTPQKHTRVYVDGYDLSGYTRSIGPLSIAFDSTTEATLSETVKGGLCGYAAITPGPLNGLFDSTAAGLHAVLNAPGAARTMLVAVGIRAAPAAGDQAFCGVFQQSGYPAEFPADGMVLANAEFGLSNVTSGPLGYGKAWGVLLHALSAETGANTGAGIDGGAATTNGGFFVYQIFSKNGTATLSVDDSADNSNWAALSGATSGSVSPSPAAGLVALSPTATVRRYLRWQLALGSATTVTFACAFVRG